MAQRCSCRALYPSTTYLSSSCLSLPSFFHFVLYCGWLCLLSQRVESTDHNAWNVSRQLSFSFPASFPSHLLQCQHSSRRTVPMDKHSASSNSLIPPQACLSNHPASYLSHTSHQRCLYIYSLSILVHHYPSSSTSPYYKQYVHIAPLRTRPWGVRFQAALWAFYYFSPSTHSFVADVTPLTFPLL